MNQNDKEVIEELIKKHQKSEAHEIKEFTRLQDWIAVELEEHKMDAWKSLIEQHRRRMVIHKHIIQDLAPLLGKKAPNRQIRVSGMMHILPTEVI